jgi:hypothetical protein
MCVTGGKKCVTGGKKCVCNMVGKKSLEPMYSTFFIWCCFSYVHFCELYLSCVYCCHLICICCILCVFVVPYVYLLYLILYLLYYLCIAAFTLDAGLLARSQYPEVLRRATSTQVFLGFPVSTSEC